MLDLHTDSQGNIPQEAQEFAANITAVFLVVAEESQKYNKSNDTVELITLNILNYFGFTRLSQLRFVDMNEFQLTDDSREVISKEANYYFTGQKQMKMRIELNYSWKLYPYKISGF